MLLGRALGIFLARRSPDSGSGRGDRGGRALISALWASYRDVEELLAERGIEVGSRDGVSMGAALYATVLHGASGVLRRAEVQPDRRRRRRQRPGVDEHPAVARRGGAEQRRARLLPRLQA